MRVFHIFFDVFGRRDLGARFPVGETSWSRCNRRQKAPLQKRLLGPKGPKTPPLDDGVRGGQAPALR